MKKIFNIFKRDVKAIFTNYVALIIIIALIILPSLYAWVNIKANWDPYGGTEDIKIAIVNEDKGAKIENKEFNVGDRVVEQLKKNTKLGWTFVSKEEAEEGLKYRKYYAAITIPKDFSKDLLTVIGDKPKKPSLIYEINEKSNAIVPKIASSGANSLKNTITENVVSTINDTVFTIFNEIGIKIQNNYSKIKSLIDGIFYLDKNIDRIEKDLVNYKKGLKTAEEVMNALKKDLPKFKDTMEKINNIADESRILVNDFSEKLNDFGAVLSKDLDRIQKLVDTISSDLGGIKNNVNNAQGVTKVLTAVKEDLDTVEIRIQGAIKKIEFLLSIKDNPKLTEELNKLKKIDAAIVKLQGEVDKIISKVQSGKGDVTAELDKIVGGLDKLSNSISENRKEYNSKIKPIIDNVISESLIVLDNAQSISKNLNNLTPKVNELINTGLDASTKGDKLITGLLANMPSLKKDIHTIANKISFLKDENSMTKLIDLLEHDPKMVADFIAAPVNLEEVPIYHIPNYGSAMAPFYSVLAIWVGVVLMTAILSVEAKGEEEYTAMEEYFGKGLLFLVIALLQSAIIALGDKYILGVYMDNVPLFIGLCMFISVIFTFIVYTLVSVFGNIGKGIAIILLVLQISSSGGTFPIEVIPSIFQKISGLLPFTYGIGAVREAQGGVVIQNLYHDLGGLIIFGLVFIGIALLLKKPLSKLNHAFSMKFKESGLGE